MTFHLNDKLKSGQGLDQLSLLKLCREMELCLLF